MGPTQPDHYKQLITLNMITLSGLDLLFVVVLNTVSRSQNKLVINQGRSALVNPLPVLVLVLARDVVAEAGHPRPLEVVGPHFGSSQAGDVQVDTAGLIFKKLG